MRYICLAVLGAVMLFFFQPIRLWLDFRHRGKTEDSLLLQVSVLWGLIKYSLEVPIISTSSEGLALETHADGKKNRMQLHVPSLQELGLYWRRFQENKDFLQRVFRLCRHGIKVKSFVWQTDFGFGDSDRLAILAGGLWALKGIIIASLNNVFNFTAPPVIRVFPRFDRNCFRVAFSCILEFPLGYAIITAFFAGCHVLKNLIRRGAKIDRTSNPGLDEDGHGKHQRNGGREYSNR